MTVLLGPMFGYLLLQSPRLICPSLNLSVIDCDPYLLPLYSGITCVVELKFLRIRIWQR